MPSQADIKHQQELLSINRRNLAQYLKRQMLLGEAYTPPEVSNGILEARSTIRRIKAILRDWQLETTDEPDDEEPQAITNQPPRTTPVSNNCRSQRTCRAVVR